ncbi:GNAT family N-acetyltransferase [Bradyrhizobium brasilense]|uniref:GNAT family N-acetyltransferase n=1 Tax=Bradyrhizobium brasilense TaxID=1419277 RepID=UPI001E592D40|nr:GNAT family N-acetyltransferase [Bradyrhizobium brasilense]
MKCPSATERSQPPTTRSNGRVVLLHTEVPQELSGLGYGTRLAHGVFEALRRDGKRVIAKCPFMSSYAARHPEYGALLDG